MFYFSNYSKDSNFFNEPNEKFIGKMKDKFGGVIISEFVGLKSKLYWMKNIDGKEYNIAKRGALQLSLINSKIFYLIKKLLDTKWKEFKVKSINQEHIKLIKYICHVLTIKDMF